MSDTITDRITEKVLLRVPRSRVWNAIADSGEFGRWFGVQGLGDFHPGATVQGKITHKGYEHVTWEATVGWMDPGRLFSFRWHPYAVAPDLDYSGEPTTLVVFELEDDPNGTLLTVVESGFDGIPESRRAKAYEMHKQGWAGQMKSIAEYLVKKAA
ncbi:MAG: SRPBCC family protein [bacterium]|jgi:uncharacterized protein YndB with AHSA1/START domain